MTSCIPPQIQDKKRELEKSLPVRTNASWWSISYDAKKQVLVVIENTRSGWKTRLTYDVSLIVSDIQNKVTANMVHARDVSIQPEDDSGL